MFNYNDEKFDVWDYLVEHNIVTNDELQLVTDVAGYTDETINSVIYARTGFNDLEQLMEEM